MKIAVVVPGGISSVHDEGEIPALHWLIERLGRRHTLHVFSMHGARRAPYALLGTTLQHCGRWPVRLRTLAALVAEHRRGAFDLVQAFWAAPPGVIAAAAGRLLRRPVALHIGGTELFPPIDARSHPPYAPRRKRSTQFALSGARRITAASTPVIEALGALGFAGEIVPLGVDVRRWPPLAPRPRDARAPARLIHVADLNPVKDQATLLEALRRLAGARIEFRLDIAGRDTLGGRIHDAARTLDIADRVHFHGRLAHAQLYPLLAQADILWHASRFEAGPVAVLEAAVAGVPTVGTAVGHIADWAPRAAVAVPVGDAAGLADETLRLLADDARRLSIAREAQARALAHDADWTASQFERIYADLVRT